MFIKKLWNMLAGGEGLPLASARERSFATPSPRGMTNKIWDCGH